MQVRAALAGQPEPGGAGGEHVLAVAAPRLDAQLERLLDRRTASTPCAADAVGAAKVTDRWKVHEHAHE